MGRDGSTRTGRPAAGSRPACRGRSEADRATEGGSTVTLTETAKQLLEQAVPRARELHAYRTAGATAAPEFAEPLSRLERLLAALFNTDPVDRTSRPARPRARRPQRTMMSASRALLREGVVDTWAASVEQLATEPR